MIFQAGDGHARRLEQARQSLPAAQELPLFNAIEQTKDRIVGRPEGFRLAGNQYAAWSRDFQLLRMISMAVWSSTWWSMPAITT